MRVLSGRSAPALALAALLIALLAAAGSAGASEDAKGAAGARAFALQILPPAQDPITIGENSNVQDASVLHTDTGSPLTIGACVTVGHMVMLHGCTIGRGSLIGIGSIILNGAKSGDTFHSLSRIKKIGLCRSSGTIP